MQKCYVYVLRSMKDNTFYVGLAQNPEKRLVDHNKGYSQYTKGHVPYKLLHKEICESRQIARQKEIYYKSGIGRKILNNLFPCSSAGRASGC